VLHAAIARSLTSNSVRLRLSGASAVLRSYIGHTITALSYDAGSTQLGLHLQTPAAAAAKQQAVAAAAEAAEAAAEAAAAWHVHQVGGRAVTAAAVGWP
jgi:hypothetical protein